MAEASRAENVVMACVDAINREEFREAKQYVSDDFSFIGVLGSRNGAEAYFLDMERMRLKYSIKKSFADEQDVCLFYDLSISGKMIFGSAWYHVEDGRILSLRVVFDPRPLLEA